VYSATFVFDKKQFDDEFHRLDALIAAAAKQTAGYLGEEAWEDPRSGRICNIYYWETEEGMMALMNNPYHLEAKKRYTEWLGGYQVVIAKVLRAYGDGLGGAPAEHSSLQENRIR
jgi:heme-degrading monooxygenase HmoA